MQIHSQSFVRDGSVISSAFSSNQGRNQVSRYMRLPRRHSHHQQNTNRRGMCCPVASAPASPAKAIQEKIPLPVKGERVRTPDISISYNCLHHMVLLFFVCMYSRKMFELRHILRSAKQRGGGHFRGRTNSRFSNE